MKKYARVNKRTVAHPVRDGKVTVWDIKALVDIPAHNVRAGDIGGVIDRRSTLSQSGDAWIGGLSYVLDNSTVKNDALVTDKAVISGIVVKDHAKVSGNAIILEGNRPDPGYSFFFVSDFAEVTDYAQVSGSFITGNSVVKGQTVVTGATLKGTSVVKNFARLIGPGISITDTFISGSAEVMTEAKLWKSYIHCSAQVLAKATINSSVIAGNTKISNESVITACRYDHRGKLTKTDEFNVPQCSIDGEQVASCSHQYMKQSVAPPLKLSLKEVLGLEKALKKSVSVPEKQTSFDTSRFDELMASYANYEKDIVKLIKYPVMTDLTDEHTAAFHSLLRKVRRAIEKEDQKAYDDLIDRLDDAFFAAESNARKIATSLFSDEDKSKVTDAGQMIAMALDEKASETEKKNAYRGAMRNLEGRISLPEVTIMDLIEKIGLKELEA